MKPTGVKYAGHQSAPCVSASNCRSVRTRVRSKVPLPTESVDHGSGGHIFNVLDFLAIQRKSDYLVGVEIQSVQIDLTNPAVVLCMIV